MTLTATWTDFEREPKCAPDPAFPAGMDIDLSKGARITCQTMLAYPAKRCGAYVISCDNCRQRVALTTAGRPDDPRVITLGCFQNQMLHGQHIPVTPPDYPGIVRTPHEVTS